MASSDRKEKTRQLLLKGIRSAADDFPATLEKMADFRRRFTRYSFHNRFLVMLQRPSARAVKGYREWQREGRQVQKGESSIGIWAPLTSTAEDEEEAEREGVRVGHTYIYGFTIASVFDISQTELMDPERFAEEHGGEPEERFTEADIPTATFDLGSRERPQLYGALKGACEARGTPVEEVSFFPGHLNSATTEEAGRYLTEKDRIELKTKGRSCDDLAATLAHESAHAVMRHRHGEGEGSSDEEKGLSSARKEIEAEAAGFLACRMLGLDTSERAFPYLSHWMESAQESLSSSSEQPDSDEDEPKASPRDVLSASLRRIHDAAEQIATDAAEHLPDPASNEGASTSAGDAEGLPGSGREQESAPSASPARTPARRDGSPAVATAAAGPDAGSETRPRPQEQLALAL